MKLQTVALILVLATLGSAAPGHLLKALIHKKLSALPSFIAGIKSSLSGVKEISSPVIQESTFRFAGSLDTVEVPAPVVHVETVAAPAPVLHVETVEEPTPDVHVETIAAPATSVHVETVAAPAPIVHVETVPALAPIVPLDVPAAAAVYSYAPYYTSPVYYKEVHPVSHRVYVNADVHKTTLGGLRSGLVKAIGSFSLGIQGGVTKQLSSSATAVTGSANAEFSYASAY